jgi:hypothetical protein
MTIFSQSYNMVCAVRTFGAHQNCSNYATQLRKHAERYLKLRFEYDKKENYEQNIYFNHNICLPDHFC